eukprot:CFRG2359T1
MGLQSVCVDVELDKVNKPQQVNFVDLSRTLYNKQKVIENMFRHCGRTAISSLPNNLYRGILRKNNSVVVSRLRAHWYSSDKINSYDGYTYGTVLSGIQPTGVPTLGNYLGALQNWARMQETTKTSLYSVVDLHALTIPQDPETLRKDIRKMVVALLAIGIDPKKSIIFQQSCVRQHAELAWMLSCSCPIGILNKMTQWKDKGSKTNKLLGLFSYPVLMAADILVYNATHVPVGADQRQHLELTRDIAGIFNQRFNSDHFILPEAIYNDMERVMSLRDPKKKMSKSDPNGGARINLNDSDDQIMAKVRKAVTDGEAGIVYDQENRLAIANLIDLAVACTGKTHDQVCKECHGMDKLQFKEYLAHAVISVVSPIREEMSKLENDRGYVDGVLKDGAVRATAIAEENMQTITRDVRSIHPLVNSANARRLV